MAGLNYYATYRLDDGDAGQSNPDLAMRRLRSMFPTGAEPDRDNVVLFSTSGVHGTYATIEDVEVALRRPENQREPGDDLLTVLVLKPRQVITQAGNVRVTLEDIPYLKRLRTASWAALVQIGAETS